jgi:hypothetical protein
MMVKIDAKNSLQRLFGRVLDRAILKTLIIKVDD